MRTTRIAGYARGQHERSGHRWQRIMEPEGPPRSSSGHNPAVTRCEGGSGLVCYGRETDRCSYVLSRGFFGFGEEVGDLSGEVLGAGAGQAGGGDDSSV